MKRMICGALLLAAASAMAGAQTAAAGGEHQEQKTGRTAARSTELVVRVDGKAATLTLAELQAMPQRTLLVHNGHSNVDESYTGVGVNELLAKFGLTLDGAGAKRVYHSYVRAEGTDSYWVLYSAAELEQGLRTTDSIVALMEDGKPLGTDGALKMIVAGEKRPARWVRNLASLTVVTVE